MNELALFAGAGGGILGGHLLGWRCVCAVERDAYAAGVLAQRQNDGCLPPFPIWSDVTTFDGRPWRGHVDVVSGGFPCQDISVAGKGAGLAGARSGLWSEMRRIIGEVRPRYVLVENVPMLTTRGGTTVVAELAEMGYDAQWGIVGAHHAGAPHKRDRLWIVCADSQRLRCDGEWQLEEGQQRPGGWTAFGESAPFRETMANAECIGTSGNPQTGESIELEQSGEWVDERQSRPGPRGVQDDTHADSESRRLPDRPEDGREAAQTGRVCESESPREPQGTGYWEVEPGVGRVVDGVAYGVDRLKALGNGQVPAVVRLAWQILRQGPGD